MVAHPGSILVSVPPFWFLRHLEGQYLCLQHLLLHEPPLLLAADGRHFNALHLRLGLGGFLGQQLGLLLCNLGFFSQQVCCLFWSQLERNVGGRRYREMSKMEDGVKERANTGVRGQKRGIRTRQERKRFEGVRCNKEALSKAHLKTKAD